MTDTKATLARWGYFHAMKPGKQKSLMNRHLYCRIRNSTILMILL
jgi:hypothetical protein